MYKQQLHPKWVAELREKERVIAELHTLIRDQEKEKIDNLYTTGTKHRELRNDNSQFTFTQDGFGRKRLQTEGSKNNRH